MDKSLNALCDAIKKTILLLKPQQNSISFLLLIGKNGQGKSTFLHQSACEQVTLEAHGASIYYNRLGIILELSQSFINNSKLLLDYTLKQINRCHRLVKVTGIMLCIDTDELLTTEQDEIKLLCKTHTQLIERFARALGYRTKVALLFTKLDVLAGFCDFFQNEHEQELQKPLGFSLHDVDNTKKAGDIFKQQFEKLIESLGQKVIEKIHPVRSSAKRTLIREFPLQLATLRTTIAFIVNNISSNLLQLECIYFSSGEQGGISVDRLNKKIQKEYALTIRDEFPQSMNYRAYFIIGALLAFQEQTKSHPPLITKHHRLLISALIGAAVITFLWIGEQYYHKSNLLDEASKQLIAYDSLSLKQQKSLAAKFYLTKATSALNKISTNSLTLPTINTLKSTLKNNTESQLNEEVIPSLLHELEQAVSSSSASYIERYNALKIYLMLNDKTHFSESEIIDWFQQHWKNLDKKADAKRKLSLLRHILHTQKHSIQIEKQIVKDTRNYLNALPASYLYYSLAKTYFPKGSLDIRFDGFSQKNPIPIYLTKKGFNNVYQSLDSISKNLLADNWILARQDLDELPILLKQAYCYEYVLWWQHFMQQTNPLHAKNYTEAHQLIDTIKQHNTINKIVSLIMQQTSPKSGVGADLFNHEIANKFTEISLMSQSSVKQLNQTLNELGQFLRTLAIIQDQGKTAFNLTKARFQGDTTTNPLSVLFNTAASLPAPIANWATQIAEDTWFSLINDSRNYLNLKWQELVLHDYQRAIAHRYPFSPDETDEIAINDFNQFFSPHGVLNRFIEDYIKPFLDTSKPQWALKEANHYVLPISTDLVNELMRANVITNMFFAESDVAQIDFSLQKISLDPIVSNLKLTIGNTKLSDTQTSDSFTEFHWPESNALLILNSIEGKHYELEELGTWAFFKILQKVNVLVDEQDSANLQILFEINGNTGRYLLKTQNQVNPFIPGILNEFNLPEEIV